MDIQRARLEALFAYMARLPDDEGSFTRDQILDLLEVAGVPPVIRLALGAPLTGLFTRVYTGRDELTKAELMGGADVLMARATASGNPQAPALRL